MSLGLETIHLPHFPPSLPVHVALYRDLDNASFLRQQLIAGNTDFEYALVDASMVCVPTAIVSRSWSHLSNRKRTGILKDPYSCSRLPSRQRLPDEPSQIEKRSFGNCVVLEPCKQCPLITLSVSRWLELTGYRLPMHFADSVLPIPQRICWWSKFQSAPISLVNL